MFSGVIFISVLKDFLIIYLIRYPYRAEMVRAKRLPVRPVVVSRKIGKGQKVYENGYDESERFV